MKALFLLFLIGSTLFANLHEKSAIIYYGEEISYPMVGIHDYIIVKPQTTNVYTHGFSVYKEKMYAFVSIDAKARENSEKFFQEQIAPQIKRGFQNFYFESKEGTEVSNEIITAFHKKYPTLKLIVKQGFANLDKTQNALTALLSYSCTQEDVAKAKAYALDVICVNTPKIKGAIPYSAEKHFLSYGTSSKNALKREILTLVDESTVDRSLLSAHQHGALPLEYAGYIQKLYDVSRHPLPNMDAMSRYGGVVIWLTHNYKEPQRLIQWIKKLRTRGIKIVFANIFGFESMQFLEELGIQTDYFPVSQHHSIVSKDAMIGYEIDVPLSNIGAYLSIEKGKKLLVLEDEHKHQSMLAAITPWGGYAIGNAFITAIGEDNLWVINPFEFFIQALRLPKIPVPDTTTEYGKRILFSHVDGDGIMNKVEWNTQLYSGNTILEDIVKKYPLPLSISIIGAEVDDKGLYPEIAPKLQKIVKQIYKEKNVEPATHTFTHPFIWGKIKNDNLDEKYRLKPKGYTFSLKRELKTTLDNLNAKYTPRGKKPKAQTVFWSGNCSPTEEILEYVYKNNILNINGGDTYVTNTAPWLTNIAPMGIARGEYYQVYTGAQNENVYTNDWLGPYWGFKRVIQTFKLTNSPRRLKPIDIYYHLYSGSKRASLYALQFVYDWVLKQDVFPMYTSKFIPKVMDYYTVSIAKNKDKFLLAGMKDLKTVRVESKNAHVDFQNSENILGYNHFENHTYIHAGKKQELILKTTQKEQTQQAYLVSTNARPTVKQLSKKRVSLDLKGFLPINAELYIPKGCTLTTQPKTRVKHLSHSRVRVKYKKTKEASLDVRCKL